jgi:hypothetical protein
VNLIIIRGLCEILEINTPILSSRDFELVDGQTSNLINICNHLGATNYLTGPSASNYLDEGAFHESGIQVEWMDYSSYCDYEQLHPPFDQQVSILDLLFNAGKSYFLAHSD